MDDLSRFCCLNAECAEHGKRGAGNLLVCGRSGKTNRLLRCRRCQSRFSESKGTVFFRSHLRPTRSCRSSSTSPRAWGCARPAGCYG